MAGKYVMLKESSVRVLQGSLTRQSFENNLWLQGIHYIFVHASIAFVLGRNPSGVDGEGDARR